MRMMIGVIVTGTDDFPCESLPVRHDPDMNLEQILAAINAAYPDPDIAELVGAMSSGRMDSRKQLADLVCRETAALHPTVIHEISKWGVNDDLSRCAEIRRCA